MVIKKFLSSLGLVIAILLLPFAGLVTPLKASAVDRQLTVSTSEVDNGNVSTEVSSTASNSAPTAPKTGKLIGATIASISIITAVLLIAKEVKQSHNKWESSEK
jgi:hypothetical protein